MRGLLEEGVPEALAEGPDGQSKRAVPGGPEAALDGLGRLLDAAGLDFGDVRAEATVRSPAGFEAVTVMRSAAPVSAAPGA